MSRRPRIAVTGPDRGGLAAWLFTAHAVRRAGGKPVRIRPTKERSLEDIDGLIIGGGEDVDPELYGESPMSLISDLRSMRHRLINLASSGATWLLAPLIYLLRWLLRARSRPEDQQTRDDLETRLINQALERGLPMLGICRGAQLINVCLGGSLHQELHDFYVEAPQVRSVLPAKQVRLMPETRLLEITGRERFRVNALHSQAVNRLGEGMRIAAVEHNGVIQAIEHQQRPILGVQWHPEYLPQHSHQRALFTALVRESQGQHA